MRIRPVASFCLATAIATAISLAAQTSPQTPPAPSQQPPIRVETNFVRVDVYPTKDGKPLPGLKAEDFEVLEDGVVQQIKSFEHVVIAPAGPPETRREPSSQRDMMQQATNPRSRVFVIYLDTWNVNVGGSHNIAEPIIRLLDRIIGPDDLVGIMTTEMAASQVILARKTQVIEDGLRKNWAWGLRHSLQNDNREFAYKACYPPLPRNPEDAGKVDSALATKMIQRKRERASFEAMEDLVLYLGAIREERKAVIVITEGWLKFRPDHDMMKPRKSDNYTEHYGPDRIGVDLHGKLTTNENRDTDPSSLGEQQCATDRMRLAMLDNDVFFRDMLDEANRMNVSFYPVDPRGLPAFDSPIGPEPPPPVNVDHAILRHRLETLHDMALATDGLAVVGSNDLDKGLQRISDDLTSYYLLGYYSTNTKLDGRFRRLQVKVKQPGVQVRARRGYRAATAEEAAAARSATDKPSPEKTAFNNAMGMLSRVRPDSRFRINAAVQKHGDGGTVWVAGELPATSTRTDEYALGSTAAIEVRAGDAATSASVTLKPGERGFVVPVKLPAGNADRVQVRARLTSEGSPVPLTDAIDVTAVSAQPLAFRRGSSTGNRYLPAADFRFSRTERLRLELPVGADVKPSGAKILDRTGQTLPIPLTTSERTDADTGQKWIMADLTLAPLAAGDYAIEVTTETGNGTQQVITAIRVTR
jgi:VWFA-related protein